jgi:phosphate uptake regulator
MEITERNLQEIGKSLLMSLPKSWTKTMKLRKGSKVKLMTTQNGNLLIAPEFAREEKKRDSTINYDSNFKRRFFQEYFNGYENITVKFTSSISEKERKDFYLFLKRFMNCQIIEENKSEIKIKSFRIEELSIQECLRRMHMLSLSMLEELYEKNEKIKTQEMRDTATRFYYILVMQIRRFLSEGKYTDENQISLTTAMDMRMIAEKIQRICEIISYIKKDAKQISLLKEIDNYYSRAFNFFMNKDFEKALPLWQEGKNLQNKIEHQKNENARDLSQIVRLSREISMLVR